MRGGLPEQEAGQGESLGDGKGHLEDPGAREHRDLSGPSRIREKGPDQNGRGEAAWRAAGLWAWREPNPDRTGQRIQGSPRQMSAEQRAGGWNV